MSTSPLSTTWSPRLHRALTWTIVATTIAWSLGLSFLIRVPEAKAAPGDLFAYVANNGSNNVSAYSINSTTGALTAVAGSPFAAGTGPIDAVITPNGNFLYVTNTVSDNVSAYSINSTTGALTAVAGSPFAAGTAPVEASVTPNGNFLYVANLISNNVSAYSINSTTGALTAVAGSPFAAGTNPDGTSITPSGNFLYLANNASNNVSAYSINSTTGALTQVAGSPFAATAPTDSKITPNGNFLYVAANGVTAFSINSSTGALMAVNGSPFQGGAPVGLSVTPNGSFLYGADLSANNVRAFSINSTTGALTAVAGSPFASGTGPNFMATFRVAGGTPPTLSGGGPQNTQTFVPPEAIIDITSDVDLNSATVTTANVTLYSCTGATDATSCASPVTQTNLCSSVSLTGNRTIVCSHTSPFPIDTTLRFQIGTGVQSSGSVALTSAVTRIFRTSSFNPQMNTTPPRVESAVPPSGSLGVSTNAPLIFRFPTGPEGNMLADGTANAINNANNIRVRSSSHTTGGHGSDLCVAGSCTLAWDATARTLTISGLTLPANSQMEWCVLANTRNTAGQSFPGGGDACYGFGTAAGADSTAPTLATTAPVLPANGTTAVDRFNPGIRLSFSERLAPASVNATNVRLYIDTDTDGVLDQGETVLDANTLDVRLEQSGTNVSVGLKTSLNASTRYCYSIVGTTSGVTDLSGNAIAASTSNCFTTGATSDSTGPSVLFTDADNFKLVVRFSEGVTNASATSATNYNLQCPTGVPVSLTGKTIQYFPERQEAEIHGLGLPNGQTCQVTVTGVSDLAGNAIVTANSANVASFQPQSSAATGGFLGGGGATQDFHSSTNFGSFWEKPTWCEPENRVTGKGTKFRCEFPAPGAMDVGSTAILTFPSGFTFSTSDGSTRAIPAASANCTGACSWDNQDLNGPATGKPVISGVTVSGNNVTVSFGTAAIGADQQVRFELDRLTTPATPQSDKRVSIVVKNSSGVKIGQTLNGAPFSVQQGGSLSIAGSVYKDSNSNSARDAGEGISGMRVFCNQMGGFTVGTTTGPMAGNQETMTGADGTWSITGLGPGQYGCSLPPDPTRLADVIGGNQWQEVFLQSTSKTGVDFKFRDLSTSGGRDLAVTITGSSGLANKQVDVFCHAGATDFQFSQPVMKVVTLNGQGGGSTTVKLLEGKTYECGLGPHIDFSNFSGGGPPPVPEFDFLPPPMQRVAVPTGSNPTGITFALRSADNTIPITVQDGSSNGIANVFVNVNPQGCFSATTGAFESCHGWFGQTNSSGLANAKVNPGTFSINVFAPGLPPAPQTEVTVSTGGILTQKGATVTGITVTLTKSSTTVAGTIQDETGQGIPYAHVDAQQIATGGSCTSFTPTGFFTGSPTDANGTYTLYVGNGTYNIRAFSPVYGELGCITAVVSGSSLSGKNISATVGNFQTLSGTAPDGAFIDAFGSSGFNHTVATNGAFNMKVKQGTYTVVCFAHGKGECGRQASVNLSTADQIVNFGTTTTTGTVSVTITGITDACVDVRDANGRGNSTCATTNSGTYTVEVPPGSYTVRCGGPKYGDLCGTTGQAAVVTANTTRSITGTPPANLRSITGRITDGTSNLAGVNVSLTTSDGKSVKATSGGQSGTTSNLSVANVPDGTYTLTAAKKGYEPAQTTATVSGGNLTLSSPVALTQATGSTGDTVTVSCQQSGATYTGEGRVVATKTDAGVTKTIIADVSQTNGQAALDLTNGTWTVKAVATNGRESATSTVTVSGGSLQGTAPTLGMDTAITGFTAATTSTTMSPKAGVKASFPDIGTGFEVNIPPSVLSTTDSSTGKVEVKKDPSVKTVLENTDPNTSFVGSNGYEITPKDANGNALGTDDTTGATLTVPYTEADLSAAGVDEGSLQFAVVDENTGQPEFFPTECDTTNNLCTVQMKHFSTGGLLGSGSSGSPSVSDATPPGAVTSISSSATASAVTITWTDPTDADLDSVEVLRSNPPSSAVSGTPLSRVAKGTKQFVDTGVTAATTYTYILRSRDTSGNTRNSGAITVTTTAAGAAAPSTGTVAPAPAAPAAPTVTTPAAPAAPTAPGASAIGLSAGDLVKASGGTAVYLVGADGKRYVYPNDTTYKSWYADFSGVKQVTDSQLASLSLGGAVTVRPGTWLVKIESDPKVYAVEPGGVLRWVETEARANLLFGPDWNRQIVDVPVSYWPTYKAGTPLGADVHPTGTLVASGGATYYIDQGKKRMVTDSVFSVHGFARRWVRTLNAALVYGDGPVLASDVNLRFAGVR